LSIILATGGALLLNFFYRNTYAFGDNSGQINGIQGCYELGVDHSVWIVWIVYLLLLIHESAILILTLFKTYRYGKSASTSLFSTLLIDGILFYICIVFLSILNIVFLGMTFDFTHVALGLALLHRNLNTVLCIRLMFNIRKAVDQEMIQGERRVSDGEILDSEVLIAQEIEID